MLTGEKQQQSKPTIFIEEPRRAYDGYRVRILLSGQKRTCQYAHLKGMPQWFSHIAANPVTTSKLLKDHKPASGAELPYDNHLLAIGSAPIVSASCGTNLKEVFVYRTTWKPEQSTTLIIK